MNLKVLFMIIIYYGVLSLLFVFGSDVFLNDWTPTISLNDTDVSVSEQDTGGLFSVGVSFARFFGFVGFGVGLAEDTPTWFSVMFALWQTMVTILVVGFVISSIWDG